MLLSERKPKSKKEKMADKADGVSDLLAQMTLESSSSEKANAQTWPAVVANLQEVVLLDTPVSHKPHQRLTEKCPGTPLSQADSSPAAIDALRLSDIDWDASSFAATPRVQAANEDASEKLNLLAPFLKPVASSHKDDGGLKISGEATPNQTKEDKNPAPKYKFVRTAAAKVQRCLSEPCQADKDRTVAAKKSVCTSVCSSSEDSDAENRQIGPRRATKSKPGGRLLLDRPRKPVCGPPKTTSESVRSFFQSAASGDHVAKLQRQTQQAEGDMNDVSPPILASPIGGLDSDESVICGDSPLPLVERLRLKFLKI